MRQNEAITKTYLSALANIGVPVYTAIPDNAPKEYVYIFDVSQSPETTTKTEFEYLMQIILEVHVQGDVYAPTVRRVLDISDAIQEALQPAPHNVIQMQGGYYMLRQRLLSERNDNALFTATRIMRNILIFEAQISK
jgi:hypothetical protein